MKPYLNSAGIFPYHRGARGTYRLDRDERIGSMIFANHLLYAMEKHNGK